MHRKTIGDLAESGSLVFSDGYRTRRSELGEPGYRILRVADVDDWSVSITGPDFVSQERSEAMRSKLSRPGDVLLTTKGTVGRVAIYPDITEQVVYSPQLCYFRVLDPEAVNARYLAYWFKSPSFAKQSLHRANNTDMAPYINMRDIRSLEVDLPGVGTQRAIAEVLGALDDKIAANDRAAEVAEELISALYARAVGSVGTTARPLFEVLTIEFGEPFKGEMFSEPGTGRPLIRIRDLKTMKPQIWTTESRLREVEVEPGDVLVGMDAEFRAQWWLGEPGLLNQRVCRARGDSFGNAFVAQSLVEPLARLENEKSATTVIHLNKSDLERSAIRLPAAEPLSEFERGAEPLLGVRVALAKENGQLAAARDELLPLLMSGRIRVDDAQNSLEQVL